MLKMLSPKVKYLRISEFTAKIQFLHYKVPLECGDEDMCHASLTMSDLALVLQILKTKPHIVVRLVLSRLLCDAIFHFDRAVRGGERGSSGWGQGDVLHMIYWLCGRQHLRNAIQGAERHRVDGTAERLS